ncbi:DUF7935 family protein [Leeuwenhoekiella nanhaiensis]|uniref:Uncharacterized protein n=1 Tax=Leeuwenhoekiella nanhaiensis TaxID=1655491 RepID=A0A2G1VQW7_9FLAO|nr:hypothetical protein [Leeuwenhoekiella nanhaiensis]PHQ29153.1 hypothetical protein CJ305_11125 [Leeuwenhoekiella nanhaiensis]
MDQILEIAIAVGPAIVVGVIAYYFFDSFLKNEEGRRRFLLHKESQKDVLPVRLQAYERLTLFLERINPNQLLIRVKPVTEDKKAYVDLLAATIEQEFEHNLTQQIYISSEGWGAVKSAKNTLIQQLRKAAAKSEITTAQQLREHILQNPDGQENPSRVALEYLKTEVQELFN